MSESLRTAHTSVLPGCGRPAEDTGCLTRKRPDKSPWHRRTRAVTCCCDMVRRLPAQAFAWAARRGHPPARTRPWQPAAPGPAARPAARLGWAPAAARCAPISARAPAGGTAGSDPRGSAAGAARLRPHQTLRAWKCGQQAYSQAQRGEGGGRLQQHRGSHAAAVVAHQFLRVRDVLQQMAVVLVLLVLLCPRHLVHLRHRPGRRKLRTAPAVHSHHLLPAPPCLLGWAQLQDPKADRDRCASQLLRPIADAGPPPLTMLVTEL